MPATGTTRDFANMLNEKLTTKKKKKKSGAAFSAWTKMSKSKQEYGGSY